MTIWGEIVGSLRATTSRRTFLAGAVGLALAAQALPAAAATPDGTLVIAKNLVETQVLDPGQEFAETTGDALNNLYLRLVRLDPKDFTTIVGGAAESWEVAPDHKSITFTIRPGIKFQSGRELTADDAAFSMQRSVILNKAGAFMLRQFGWNETNVKDQIRVENGKLVVNFDKPYAPELALAAFASLLTSVLDKEVVLSHEVDGDLGNKWLSTNSAGAGPYHLATYKPQEVIILEANPDFVLGKPKLDRVIIRHVPDSATQRLLLERGDVDIAENLTADQTDAVSKNPDIKIQPIAKGSVIAFYTNFADPILANPKVQEAVRYLIDRDGIVNGLLRGQHKPYASILVPEVPGAYTDQPFTYDPEKAKQLIAEAGYPEGFTIGFDVPNVYPYAEIAEALQSSFAKGGVNLEIKKGDIVQVITIIRARKHQSYILLKALDYVDANTMAEFHIPNLDDSDGTKASKTIAWRNHWKTPELTKLVEDAKVEADAAKRLELYRDIFKRTQQEGPINVILQKYIQTALRKNIDGYASGAPYDSAIWYEITK